MTKIGTTEAADSNRVKVVTNCNGMALYFFCSKIPSKGTCFLHVGLYVYSAGFLKRFTKLERTPLEVAEGLEQLRALEHGTAFAWSRSKASLGASIHQRIWKEFGRING